MQVVGLYLMLGIWLHMMGIEPRTCTNDDTTFPAGPLNSINCSVNTMKEVLQMLLVCVAAVLHVHGGHRMPLNMLQQAVTRGM